MSTTLSVQGVLYRSNVFDKYLIGKIACSSGEATKMFASTVDLTVSPLPAFPYAISTQEARTISFLFMQAIGGACTIRLVKDGYYTAALNTTYVAGEVPVGINDDKTFSLAHAPINNTLSVFDAGVRINATGNWAQSGQTLQFTNTPNGTVTVDYVWSPSVNPSPLSTQSVDVTLGSTTLATGDTILMSGVDLSRIFVTSVEKGCILEVIGAGY